MAVSCSLLTDFQRLLTRNGAAGKSRYKDRIDPRQIFVGNRSSLRTNRSTEMISVVPLMSAALIEVVLPQIIKDSGIVESS